MGSIITYLLAGIIVFTTGYGCDRTSPPPSTDTAAASKQSRPKSAAELHAEGLKLYQEHRTPEAIAIWLKEAQLDPRNARIYSALGSAYRCSGDYPSALASYQKAIGLDPNFSLAYYGIGLVYFDQARYEQAKPYLLKAAELNRKNADAYYYLGRTLSALNAFEEAIRALQEVVSLQPSYPDVHYYLGKCYSSLDKNDLAQIEFRREIELHSETAQQAHIASLKIDLQRDPRDVDALFALAMEYKTDDSLQAISLFKKVAQLRPSYPDVHFQIGKLSAQQDPSSVYSVRLEYLTELKYHPDSKNAKEGLTDLRMRMEDLLDPAEILKDKESDFWKVTFPQKGLVVSDYTQTLLTGTLLRAEKLSRGTVVSISGIYERAIAIKEGGPFDVFYTIAGGSKLIKATDIILQERVDHPEVLSRDGRVRIIVTPVDVYRSRLWLKAQDKDFVLLEECGATPYEDSDFNCVLRPIILSEDGNYVYTPGRVFTAEGGLLWSDDNLHYGSPVWWGKSLFLRGCEGDDAVYLLDLNAKKLRVFLDVPDGEKMIGLWDYPEYYPPIQVKDGLIEALFIRADPTLRQGLKPCLIVTVKADRKGNVVSKSRRLGACDADKALQRN